MLKELTHPLYCTDEAFCMQINNTMMGQLIVEEAQNPGNLESGKNQHTEKLPSTIDVADQKQQLAYQRLLKSNSLSLESDHATWTFHGLAGITGITVFKAVVPKRKHYQNECKI